MKNEMSNIDPHPSTKPSDNRGQSGSWTNALKAFLDLSKYEIEERIKEIGDRNHSARTNKIFIKIFSFILFTISAYSIFTHIFDWLIDQYNLKYLTSISHIFSPLFICSLSLFFLVNSKEFWLRKAKSIS